MAIGASLAQAHALAHRGHAHEAVALLSELEHWRGERQAELDAPYADRPAPMWLGRLQQGQVKATRELVHWCREVPEGIAYARGLYEFCAEHGATPDEIGQLSANGPLALIIPEKATPAAS